MAGFHWFGSANWYDRNHVLDVGLGEQIDVKKPWYPGTPPANLPDKKQLGKPGCLAQGDNEADGIDYDDCLDGIPVACFTKQPPDKWPDCGTPTLCTLQKFYARIIDWLYDDESGLIEQAFKLLLDPAVVVNVRPQMGNFPAIATCKIGNIFICVIDGTRTFQQLALQGLYSLNSPQDYGILETNPQWYAASSYVIGAMQSYGLAPGDQVMLAGHSYGAAVACIIAARLMAWNAFADLRYITYGCPKPGGIKLQTRLKAIVGINLANHDDLVTVLPPDQATLAPVQAFLSLPQLAVWTAWERPANQLGLFANGVADPNAFPLLDFTTLLAIANSVLSFQTINPITGHSVKEYWRRLQLRCPEPEWPVKPPLNKWLQMGYLGFTSFEIPSGAMGFRSPRVGSGALGLTSVSVPLGALGLQSFEVASSSLGLTSPDVAQGELGLTSPDVAQGELGLTSPDVAQGELGLTSPDVAQGELGLTSPDVAQGELGLTSPELPSGGALGETSPELPSGGALGETSPELPSGGALGEGEP